MGRISRRSHQDSSSSSEEVRSPHNLTKDDRKIMESILAKVNQSIPVANANAAVKEEANSSSGEKAER